jgi:hypothetical protein
MEASTPSVWNPHLKIHCDNSILEVMSLVFIMIFEKLVLIKGYSIENFIIIGQRLPEILKYKKSSVEGVWRSVEKCGDIFSLYR